MTDAPKIALVPKRHRESLAKHRRDRWIGLREGGVAGNTQVALADRGLVEIRLRKRPYEHMVARLTDLGAAYLEAHDERWRAAESNRSMLAQVDADRLAAGKCRHCGGPVPCWSSFGDVAVGVRASDR